VGDRRVGRRAGPVLLLFRRGLAYAVFLVSFLGFVVTTFHNFVLTHGVEVMGGAGGLVFIVGIALVAILLIHYSGAQKKRGVLA